MQELDANIITALVSAGMTFLGVIAGGYISSRALRAQATEETLRQRRAEKVAAYSEFMAAYTNLTLTASRERRRHLAEISDNEASAGIRFSSAFAVASMHAPSAVRNELKKVADLALQHAEGKDTPELAQRVNILYEVLYRDINK